MLYGVHSRTYELVPRDQFFIIDAPDELAARIGADKTRITKSEGVVHALRIIGSITEMDPRDISPGDVDCVVDRNGEEIGVEVL